MTAPSVASGLDFDKIRYLHVPMPGKTRPKQAKLFQHGGSQTVRLPREFRLPGTEAAISRTPPGGMLLEPHSVDFESGADAS